MFSYVKLSPFFSSLHKLSIQAERIDKHPSAASHRSATSLYLTSTSSPFSPSQCHPQPPASNNSPPISSLPPKQPPLPPPPNHTSTNSLHILPPPRRRNRARSRGYLSRNSQRQDPAKELHRVCGSSQGIGVLSEEEGVETGGYTCA